jgi:hypothetical protein
MSEWPWSNVCLVQRIPLSYEGMAVGVIPESFQKVTSSMRSRVCGNQNHYKSVKSSIGTLKLYQKGMEWALADAGTGT